MKWKLFHGVALLAVLVFGLAGCGNEDGGSAADPTYTPVTVESSWSYSRSNGGVRTEKIVARTNNQVTREVNDSITGKSVASEVISSNAMFLARVDILGADGAIAVTKTYGPSPGMLFVPSSATPGTRETQAVQITTQPANTQTSLSTDITVDGVETITVPAGIFSNALKIQTVISPGPTYTTWFAANVGMIRQDVNGVKSLELTSYTIK